MSLGEHAATSALLAEKAVLVSSANVAVVRKVRKHYLFVLKGNQPCLHQMAHQALDSEPCEFTSSERRGGRVTEEVRHFITSMPVDLLKPEEKLGLVRLHWGIENGSHWPANVVLEEDLRHPCQLSRRAIEVVTWLRALAYNLLAARRAAQAKTSAPAWKRVALLVRDVLVAPHAEARAVFEA